MQSSILKVFATSREYEAVKILADEMIKNWIQQMPTGENEFHYLKNSFERDGKMQGVRALLQEIERRV